VVARHGPDRLPDNAILALEAFERAQAETEAGDRNAALRWLDRACRLLPRDQTLALALATASLGLDDLRAASLFASIASENDVREAWLGLATARRRLGDMAGAAIALSRSLQRHVADPKFGGLADAIAQEAQAPGWCGLSGDCKLTIHPVSAARPLELRLDGRRVNRSAGRLPPGWLHATAVTVTTSDGAHLLGSPLEIRALTATVGCVTSYNGDLSGWAWHPGDPDLDPVLSIRPVTGRREIKITASDTSVPVDNGGLLGRPRGFIVSAQALRGMTGPLHVLGRDGRDLLGSPLHPSAELKSSTAAAASLARLYPARPIRLRSSSLTAPPAIPVAMDVPPITISGSRRRCPVDVVVAVHGGGTHVLACLDSVLADLPRSSRLIVVDDASPEPELIRALDRLVEQKRIRLIRNKRNLGFTGSANAGMLDAAGNDVILLNSDTLVAPGWLKDLRAIVYSAADIGTATPLSNDATILSYPNCGGGNKLLDLQATRDLASLARQVNAGVAIEIPVAVGFCMYIRRACLDAVGLLRADVFAQGYGEENDFCLRARHLGWRHAAAPGVFVAHVGGHSFDTAANHLRARNAALLEHLHPGYAKLIAAFGEADPLAPARRRLDLARWRANRHRGGKAVILITHAEGGGVELQIAASVSQHQADGYRAVVLRPSRAPDGSRCITVGEGVGSDYPNLRYTMPDELPALRQLLVREQPRAVELHHTVGHHPAVLNLIADLAVPYDVHVHDYAWFCGRVALVGRTERYCGEPDSVQCEACVADVGSLIDEDITIAALRQRSARLFSAARRIVVPS